MAEEAGFEPAILSSEPSGLPLAYSSVCINWGAPLAMRVGCQRGTGIRAIFPQSPVAEYKVPNKSNDPKLVEAAVSKPRPERVFTWCYAHSQVFKHLQPRDGNPTNSPRSKPNQSPGELWAVSPGLSLIDVLRWCQRLTSSRTGCN